MSCTSNTPTTVSVIPPGYNGNQPGTLPTNGVAMFFQYIPSQQPTNSTCPDGIAISINTSSSNTPLGWLVFYSSTYAWVPGATFAVPAASALSSVNSPPLLSTSQPYYWITITPTSNNANISISVGPGTTVGTPSLTVTPPTAIPYTAAGISSVTFGTGSSPAWTGANVLPISVQSTSAYCYVQGNPQPGSPISVHNPNDTLVKFNIVQQTAQTGGALTNCPINPTVVFYNASGAALYTLAIPAANTSTNTASVYAGPPTSSPNNSSQVTLSPPLPIYANQSSTTPQPMYLAFTSSGVVLGTGDTYSVPSSRLATLPISNWTSITSVGTPAYAPNSTAYIAVMVGTGDPPSTKAEIYKALPWLIGGLVLLVVGFAILYWFLAHAHNKPEYSSTAAAMYAASAATVSPSTVVPVVTSPAVVTVAR